MKSFERADRVSGELQRAVAKILTRRIKDPRLKSVVISGVRLSRDLRNAKVYYTMHRGDADRIKQAAEAFGSARGYIKRSLSDYLELRYMPELTFYYDTSFDNGFRIERLLKLVQTDHGSYHQ